MTDRLRMASAINQIGNNCLQPQQDRTQTRAAAREVTAPQKGTPWSVFSFAFAGFNLSESRISVPARIGAGRSRSTQPEVVICQ